MGEWERRWRGPPRAPDDELPRATVRFLDSLRVMVADTYPGGPGDVVAIRHGDDSDVRGSERCYYRLYDLRVTSHELLV